MINHTFVSSVICTTWCCLEEKNTTIEIYGLGKNFSSRRSLLKMPQKPREMGVRTVSRRIAWREQGVMVLLSTFIRAL